MENSTALVYIKPTVAFNRGDTFVFGAWVCTADGAGSFQRRLAMPPNPETGLVTLPEVVTGFSTNTPTSSLDPRRVGLDIESGSTRYGSARFSSLS
jgi:hypothetical protein